jgi:hypothetical protein
MYFAEELDCTQSCKTNSQSQVMKQDSSWLQNLKLFISIVGKQSLHLAKESWLAESRLLSIQLWTPSCKRIWANWVGPLKHTP